MTFGSTFMRLLAMDAEGEGAVDPSPTEPIVDPAEVIEDVAEQAEETVQEAVRNTTDLGIESFSSIDLLGFGMCLFLTVFAFKVKSFPFMVVSAIGWLMVGAHVTLESGSIMIFLLVFAISAIQLVYGAKFKGW